MTAIVAGQGLGLINTSLGLLGDQGQLGVATQGRSGEKVLVNASNGNLVIQQQDEWLVGKGTDAVALRTYNSRGANDDDNKDNWRLGLSRKTTGTYGAASVTRVAEDGHVETYYKGADNIYRCTEGAGSVDTITWDGTMWTWTDGDSLTKETYSSTGALQTVKDINGNGLTLTYNGDGLISKITNTDGEYITVDYDKTAGKTSNILSLTTYSSSSAVMLRRVSYKYEQYGTNGASSRLVRVTVDLTPQNADITDRNVYVTEYTYWDATTRIKTLQQGTLDALDKIQPNSTLSFEYETGSPYRVTKVTESMSGGDRVTQLKYTTAQTTITDPLGQNTILTYDISANSSTNTTAGQLVMIQRPAVNGSTATTTFVYDAKGNVTSVTDARDKTVTYRYDDNGNRIYERDAQGNVIERSYSATNRLLAETVYTSQYVDGALAQGGLTTRYMYDSVGRLRFVISPEGRVTEHQYTDGLRTSTRQYTDATYNSVPVTTQRTFDINAGDISYTSGIALAKDANNNGVLQVTSTQSTTTTYPSAASTKKPLGTNWRADVKLNTVSSGVLLMGLESGTWGQASYRRLFISLSNGQAFLNSYVGTASTSPTTPLGPVANNTAYVIEIETQSDGSVQLYFYEKGKERTSGYCLHGNLAADGYAMLGIKTTCGPSAAGGVANATSTVLIDNVWSTPQPGEPELVAWTQGKLQASQLTEYHYDFRGQLDKQTTYASLNSDGSGKLDGTQSITQYVYDQAGNLTQQIDGRSNVTNYAYDGLNRIKSQTEAQLDAQGRTITTVNLYDDQLRTTTTKKTATLAAAVTTLEGGAISVSTFDESGRVISIAQTAVTGSTALGTTRYTYDKLGRLISTLTPATPSNLSGEQTFYLYDAANRKVGEIDSLGALTEYVYNGDGQVTKTVRYDKPVSSAMLAALGKTPPDFNFTLTQSLLDNALKNWEKGTDSPSTAFTSSLTVPLITLLDGEPTLTLRQTNTEATQSYLTSDAVPVTAGARYEASIFAGTRRSDANLVVTFYDADQNRIETVPTGGVTNNPNDTKTGGTQLSDFRRLWGFVTAPANAVTARLMVRKTPTVASPSNDSFLSVTRPYLAPAGATNTLQSQSTGVDVRPLTTPNSDRTAYQIYDKAGRLSKTVNAVGAVTEYRYDGAGRLTDTLAYYLGLDSNQMLLLSCTKTELAGSNGTIVAGTTTITLGTHADDRRARNFYSNDGLLLGQLDAANYYTAFSYDSAGRLTQKTQYAKPIVGIVPDGNTPPTPVAQNSPSVILGRDQTTKYFYNARGQLRGVLDAEYYYTSYEYNSAGGKSKETRYATKLTGDYNASSSPTSDPEDRTTQYFYDANNRLIRTEDQPSGLIATQEFDANGNLIKSARTVKATGLQDETRAQQSQFDALGRVIAQLSGVGSKALAALPGNATDADKQAIWDNYATRYTYDQAGRMTSSSAPNGFDASRLTTYYYYDSVGRQTRTINSLGEVTGYTYNAFGERTEERQYVNRMSDLGSLTGGNQIAIASRMAVLANAQDVVAKFGYDSVGRKTLDVQQKTWIYYNAFGEIDETTHLTDAGFLTTTYARNKKGLAEVTTASGDDAMRATSASYDAFGRLIASTDDRRVNTIYKYDRTGHLIAQTQGSEPSQTFSYDAFGRTVYSVDHAGNKTAYNYNSTARTIKTSINVSDAKPEGDLISTSTLNDLGETVEIKDANGNTTTFTYNNDGQLLSTTVRNSASTVITTETTRYDKTGHVYETKDAHDVVTRFKYDAAGRVLTRTVDPKVGGANLITSYRYDAAGRAIWTQNPNGAWTHTEFDTLGRVLAIEIDPATIPAETNTDDITGDKLAMTSNPRGANSLALRTEFTYDVDGHTLTRNEGVHGTGPSSTAQRKTKYVYDTLGRRTQEIIDPDAGGLQLTTTYEYDGNNNVVARIDAMGQITRYVYDSSNRVSYVVDAEGAVTHSEYDLNGRLARTTAYATKITLASSLHVLSEANVTQTLPVVNTDVDHVNYFIYDSQGQLIWTVDAKGYATQREYDKAGNMLVQTRYYNPATRPQPGTTPSGLLKLDASYITVPTANSNKDQVEQYVYDAAHRVVGHLDAEGGYTLTNYTALTQSTTRYVNAIKFQPADTSKRLNNVAPTLWDKTLQAQAPTSGPYIELSVGHDAKTTQWFDGAGRLFQTEDPEGYLTEQLYDKDQLTGVIRHQVQGQSYSDGGDVLYTSYEYDAAGRRTREAINDLDVNEISVTTTAYTELGDVKSRTDAAGFAEASTTSYKYDKAGRLIEETHAEGKPEQATTRYVYENNGEVKKTIDARGVEAAEGTSEWAKSVRQQLLGYTAAPGKLTQEYQKLLDAYTSKQTFDSNGRVISVVDPLGGETKTDFDAFGNAIRVKDPNGNYGYFVFDQLNQATWQIDPMGYATQTVYNGLGQVDQIVKYDNVIINQHKLWSDTTKSVLVPMTDNTSTSLPYLVKSPSKDATTTIEHDKAGRQTQITDAAGYVESMSYDALGNKRTYTAKSRAGKGTETSAQDRGVYTYTYDRRGLLLEEKLPEQVTALDKATGLPIPNAAKVDVINKYEYDAQGNKTKSIEAFGLYEQRTTNYKYDALNRQTEKTGDAMDIYTVAGGDQVAKVPTETKIYDARGNLIESKAADGGCTFNYYDALNRKIAEVSPTGTLIEYTFDDASNLIAMCIYGDVIALPTVAGGDKPKPSNANNCRITKFKVDARGRQTNTIIEGVTTGQINTSTNNYEVVTGDLITTRDTDANGNVVYEEDARKNGTYTYFDKVGNKILQVDAERYVTQWEYYGNGKVKRMTRYATALDAAVTVAKDAGASTLLTKVVLNVDDDRTTEYDYDLMGHLKEERTLKVLVTTLNASTHAPTEATTTTSTKYDYNGLGQVIKKTDAKGDQIDFAYDKQGRQTLQQDPKFTDNDGKTDARHRIANEYNGLGLTRRTLELGKDDGQEGDDHITVNTYGKNGILIAQTDAQGVTQNFKVDLAGRITSKKLVRTDANSSKSTDTTDYVYDLVGRQTQQIVKNTLANSTTATQIQTAETGYSAYGDIFSKGVNGGQQEFAQFDKAGRLFKSNSGTGSVKVYVNDANGNATLTIESSDTNLKDLTLDQILGLSSGARVLDSSAKNLLQNAKTYLTFSQHNKLGRTTDTYTPSIYSKATQSTVSAQTSGQSTFVADTNKIILSPAQSATNYTTAIQSPFTGTATISPNAEQISATKTEDLSLTPTSTGWRVDMWQDLSVSLPAYPYINQTGKTVIEDINTYYSRDETGTRNGQTITTKNLYDYPGSTLNIRIYLSTYEYMIYDWGRVSRTLNIYKETDSHQLVLVATTNVPLHQYTTPAPNDSRPINEQLTLLTSSAPRLYIRDNNPSNIATKLVLYAKFDTIDQKAYIGQVARDRDGLIIPGLFEIKVPSGASSTFTCFELDDANQIVKKSYGQFDSRTSSASLSAGSIKDLNWTTDAPNGSGWYFPSESNRMNLILPPAATKLKLRYKYQKNGGTASDWISVDSSVSNNAIDLRAGCFNLGGNPTPGWFNFAYNFLPFTVGDTYNYTFDVVATDGVGTEVNRFQMNYTRSGNGQVLPSGFVKPYSLQSSIVKLTELAITKYVDLSFKKFGTQDAPQVVRLYPSSSGSGQFSWNASALTPDPLADYKFDVSIKAYIDGDLLNNWTNATLQLGPNANVVSAAALPLPQILRLTASEATADNIQLSYRKMGSTDVFLPLDSVKVNGEFRVDLSSITLPATGSVEYEYIYDAYQGSKLLNRAKEGLHK